MNNWVLGEKGSSYKQSTEDVILSYVANMESRSIHELMIKMWEFYDDAVLKETGHLPTDLHWEDHL
jgi:hypothetical protein